MSGIHTEVVSSAHAYTRSDSPWIMDRHKSAYGTLIHYLSGGGMSTFGRTVKQEAAQVLDRVRDSGRGVVFFAGRLKS